MSKHETKICPRCNNAFECKVGDVSNCQCNIELSKNTREFLVKTDYDCLCVNCLLHFNHLVNISRKHGFPNQQELLIEGLHYYKENNYWVFTELYHMLRGSCCKSGCRHCVYGFKKIY
jgi:hypothetical protein